MPAVRTRHLGVIAAFIGLGFSHAVPSEPDDGAGTRFSVLFTGDILLSRQVDREIRLTGGTSPWVNIASRVSGADWTMGNFEGAVGDPSQCRRKEPGQARSCFATPESNLEFLRAAGFDAVGVENNHSNDLGPDGMVQTAQAVGRLGLQALRFDESPYFMRVGEKTLSIVAFNLVENPRVGRPEFEAGLRRKLRLAERLSNWVIVYVHWGREFLDWPDTAQRSIAEWLVKNGADVIVGHHPHVVQSPKCIRGRPVFYSLGNHVFDQRFPSTKQGLIVECTIAGQYLSCTSEKTATPKGSSFPSMVNRPEESDEIAINPHPDCPVRSGTPAMIDGYRLRPTDNIGMIAARNVVIEALNGSFPRWAEKTKGLLSLDQAQFGRETDQPLLFLLHSSYSEMDGEVAPRPAVYELTSHGPIARWRGTSFAWPLVDATVVGDPSGKHVLCALHRTDSFIAPDPGNPGRHLYAYDWNGFGFRGLSDVATSERCTDAFASPRIPWTVYSAPSH